MTKILFWITASPTNFCLAKSLQEKFDYNLYAIYDITNKPKKFFQTQKLVNFSKVWFFHDHIFPKNKKPNLEYLSNIEKKYNINLWLLALNERIFYNFNEYHKFTTNEVLTILEQECKFFEKVLDETKPDYLISRSPNLHQEVLLYKICREKNVKTLLSGPAIFGYRTMLSSEIGKVDRINKKVETRKKSLEELQKYLHSFDAFKEMNKEFLNKKSEFDRLSAGLKFLVTHDENNAKTHFTYYGRTKSQVFFKEILYSMRKYYRKSFIDKNFVRTIDNTTPFIYFPLQTDQEATLLLGAPFYTNQIEVIKQIVQSLPIGYRLFVKEHPAMVERGWRKISYYKHIMEFPNVQLIHPSVNPEEILNNCSLVITISSTAALEAAFYNKSSILLAERDFDILPSVHKLNKIDEFPEAIRSSLHKTVDIDTLSDYVDSVNNNSFEFNSWKIFSDYSQTFYHGGHFVDVEISEDKMKLFFGRNKQEFSKFSSEYAKKIQWYKENEENKN